MSDIIIRGMEMPKCCAECFYLGCFYGELGENSYYCGGNWQIFHKKDKKGATRYTIEHPKKGVLEDCPLVELPPHGRLIDADELEEHYNALEADNGIYTEEAWETAEAIAHAPTILEESR